jgi:hypothetical protein
VRITLTIITTITAVPMFTSTSPRYQPLPRRTGAEKLEPRPVNFPELTRLGKREGTARHSRQLVFHECSDFLPPPLSIVVPDNETDQMLDLPVPEIVAFVHLNGEYLPSKLAKAPPTSRRPAKCLIWGNGSWRPRGHACAL